MDKWSEFKSLVKSGDQRAVVDAVMGEKWAITPEALKKICVIAAGYGDLNAINAVDGDKLEQTQGVEMRGNVAVIDVSGPLFRYANLFTQVSGATSYEIFAKDFKAALVDSRVESIVLNYDTPGGMVSGMIETSEMIKEARSIKPIVSYIGGDGASAGYGMACAGSKVVVSKSAIVGSIGVVTTYSSGESSDIEIVSSNAPNKRPDLSTDDGYEVVQSMVDSLESVFVEHVASCRGVTRETVLSDFGKGGVLVGEQAVLAGMADEVGSLESVIAGLASNKQEVFAVSNQASEKTQEITADFISANHPAIAEQFRSEGAASVDVDAAKKEGAKSERERIKSVEAMAMPGHEELIAGLKFDGETTGEQAAVKVLAAEKAVVGDRSASLKDLDEAPSAVEDAPEPVAKDDWDSNESLRAEFNNNKESYEAFKSAESKGLIKIQSGRVN